MHDQIGEKNEIDRSLRRQTNQPWKRARNRHHSGICERRATPPAQQQRHTECFVDHTRKWMRGIDRDRSQQRIELAFAIVVHKCACRVVQFVDSEDANSLLRQLRTQAVVPA